MGAEEVYGDITEQIDRIEGASNDLKTEFENFLRRLDPGTSEYIRSQLDNWAVLDTQDWVSQITAILQRATAPTYLGYDPAELDALVAQYAPVKPSYLTFSQPTPIVFGDMPDAPDLNLPTAPNPLIPEDFTAPDVNYDIPMPTVPVYTLPDVPVFESIIIPTAPTLPVIPPFSSPVPELDVQLPDLGLNYQEPDYNAWHEAFNPHAAALAGEYKKLMHDTLSAAFPQLDLYSGLSLDDQVSNLIKTGLGGFPPDVEQAIFDRAMVVIVDEARTNLVAVDDEYSAAGYPRPPGSLRAKRDRIRREVQDRVEAFKRDFLAKLTELIQKNTQTLMEQIRLSEDSDREFFHKLYNRQLEAAKLTFELAAQWYNMKIAYYNAQLESWKTEAQVYEIQIRANLALLEQFKLEIDAQRLKGEINQQYVQLYRAQLDGVLALIQIYTQEVEAAKTLFQMEALKMEAFKTEVEAYGAEVMAKRAEYEGYTAAINGETAKLTAYTAELDGYKTELQAKRMNLDAEIAMTDAKIKYNAGQTDIYKADMDKLLALVSAEEAQIRSITTLNTGKADQYRAEVATLAEEARVKIEGIKLDYMRAKAIVDDNNAKVKVLVEILLQWADQTKTMAIAGTSATGQAYSAILSQLTSVLQLGAQFDTIE